MPDKKARADVRDLQRDLNEFTRRFLKGIQPLAVDGDLGPGTKERVRDCKFWLGYKRDAIDATIGGRWRWRLEHPRIVRRGYSWPPQIARGVKRRVQQREHWLSNQLWGGSRYWTNRIIRIVDGRAGVTSRKRTETYGNPGSDHHVSQTVADAVDFATANNHALKDEISRRLGGPPHPSDYQDFYLRRRFRTYRIQAIAGTHGTGPHLHYGVRRV